MPKSTKQSRDTALWFAISVFYTVTVWYVIMATEAYGLIPLLALVSITLFYRTLNGSFKPSTQNMDGDGCLTEKN